MTILNSDLLLAQALAGPDPLGYKLRPDGSMCVVDRAGRKLVFSPAQVAAAGAQLAAVTVGKAPASPASPKPLSSKKPVAPTATKRTGKP